MNQEPSVKVAVFGASNVDIMGFPHQPLLYGDANVGTSVTMPGGVGRNIAENLTRLGLQVELFSFFGTDPLSDYLKNSCTALGISIGHCTTIPRRHNSYFFGGDGPSK
jgi:pseudouridine kinase